MLLSKLIMAAFPCLLFATPLLPQSTVEGTVSDTTGRSLENATVLLISAKDSSLVRGTVTNGSGAFAFQNISKGQYLVSSSFTGYKDVYSRTFSLSEKENRQIGTLMLASASNLLSNVTVAAKKPLYEQSIDRLTINVGSSVTNAGSTALDVLMRSPGITVDQQNNTLSMNGKDGVVIMLNGRINRMPVSTLVQMLAGMNAANIDKIELITTPPANFDAEGNAGFINIIMKTNTQYGTNGSWSLTGGYGKRWTGMIGFNFNHRQGKWNIYGDYGGSDISSIVAGFFSRTVTANSRSLVTEMKMNRNSQVINQNARLGIDYEVSKKTTLGLLLSGLANVYRMDEQNTSHIFINKSLDTLVTLKNKESHPLLHYAINLNLLHQFNNGGRLTVNLDRMYYSNDNVIDYVINFYDGKNAFLRNENTNSKKRTPINFWVASLDYTKRLNSSLELEAGIKGTLSDFTNDVKVETMKGGVLTNDRELTSKYYLEENIEAAYSSLQIKITEKTSAKLGLRFEYTNSNLRTDFTKNIVDRHYGRLFPSASISQTLNSSQSLNFSYNRRITRPTFNDMAPFVYFIDPNTFFAGNPALQPSISDILKGDYIIKRLLFSMVYTYEASPIANYAPTVNPVTNKQTFSSENQDSKITWALSIAAPVTVNSWWSMQNNLTAIAQRLDAVYKAQPLQLKQTHVAFNSTQTFSFPKAFTVELNGFFQTGGLFGVYRLKPRGTLNIGVQKKIREKAGVLRLNLNDVFGPPRLNFFINAPQYNLVTAGNILFSNRTIQLTYNRSFGNDKVRSSRSRTTGAEAEKQRVDTN